ncbi:hypothetical protein ACFU5O_22265 [Streptomyces sp. NPDC057445]|uniref:hypothetical protein n=1 Tax=Streptomyces sp. NPDC057445 TaxID=3346136 RepID=UPI0036C09DF1
MKLIRIRMHDPLADALLCLAQGSEESVNTHLRRAVYEYVERHGVPIPLYADGTPYTAP